MYFVHYSGQTYVGVKRFMELLGLQSICKTSYHNYPRELIVPQITIYYDQQLSKVRKVINQKGRLLDLEMEGMTALDILHLTVHTHSLKV